MALAMPWLGLPSLSLGGTSNAGPSDELTADALETIELILGRDLDADDQAWLRQYWMEEAVDQPEQTLAMLETFAVARQAIDDGTDPMALAELRTQVIDGSYCATKRTSDTAAKRLRSILAPDDLVLAADCIAGAIVTPFDVEALARSNALVGDLVGRPVDIAAIEAELLRALSNHADDWDPEGWQRLLWGEFRAAALSEFWSSVDQTTREQWAAAAKDTFNSNNHVGSTALSLEKTALREVGAVKTMATSGEHRLRSWEMDAFHDYFSLVTGAHPTPRERAEISVMFVTNFHEDPAQTIENARSLRLWLDEGYYFGEDPQIGRIRSWTADEQASMLKERAAQLFCINNKTDDPDGLRLIEILYAHDPVIDVDCANSLITRASDEILVDSGGKQFTRAVLDAHRRAFEMIFAIRFKAAERRWFDEASISDMRRGAKGLTQAVDRFQQIVGEIEAPAKVGPYLNEQRREDYAIRIYCVNKDADDPDVARLFEIIDDHDPILFEDCDRQVIVRKSDVDGLISTLSFVSSLGDFEPLTEDEIAAWPDRIEPYFDARASGPFGYRSIFAKLSYWWSHMPVDVRYRTAATLKEHVTSRDGIEGYVQALSDQSSYQTASLALCDFQKQQLAYNTQRVRMRSRAIFTTNPYADSPWLNPEAVGDDVAFYGIMAPLVQEMCAKVWK